MANSFKLIYTVNGVELTDISQKFGVNQFTHTSDIYGTAETHYIKIADPSFDIAEKLYLFGGESIEYQYGYSGGQLSSRKTATVFKYYPEFTANGAILHIIGCDDRIKAHIGVKNRSFSQLRRSDIVRRIAAENNLTPVVEDTIGNDTFSQLWTSDMQFLLDEVLPGSISASTGRGDYFLYIEDGNILHYHTPDYKPNVYRRFTVGRDGDIIRFVPSFCPDLSAALGGDQLCGIGYDPLNKVRLKFIAEDNTTGEKELAGRRTKINPKPQLADFKRVFIDTSDNIFEVTAETKYRYYTALQVKYMAELYYQGDPNVKVGTIVEVLVPKPNGGMHYSSGKYLVHGVYNTMTDAGSFLTKLILSRNSAIEGDEELNGIIRRVTVPQAQSPISNTVPSDTNTIEKIAQELD